MFYPELLEICKGNTKLLSEELIEQIDNWLYMLPNNLCDKITITRFSQKFNIDYKLSMAILEKLSDLNVLKRIFAIHCPECGHVIRITDEEGLVEAMYSINYCYACDENDINISKSNIELRYKLIKNNYDPKKTIKLCDDILGREMKDPQSTIQDIIDECGYNVNNLFYKPSVEQRKELKKLCCGVTQPCKTTKEKGDKFEDFVYYLLGLVKNFTVSEKARTEINQIDCMARNVFPLAGTIMSEIGRILYCECKNEKSKPDNTYFHKIHSTMQLSQTKERDRRFGIVFSLKPPTSKAEDLARKCYIKNNIIILSFCYAELKDIVENNENFIDKLDQKTLQLIHGVTKEFDELGL